MSHDASTIGLKTRGESGTRFLSTLSEGFDSGVAKLNDELSDALNALTLDPSNPQRLAEYQSRLSEYTLYRNAQSNVVKVYKDVSSAIVSNFR